MRSRVPGASGGRGRGVFYWFPEAMTAPRLGSPWENCALFDARGRLLPSIEGLTGERRRPR